MQIYYESVAAIEQQTRQLDNVQCAHCQQTQQLLSHGFIRKKSTVAIPKWLVSACSVPIAINIPVVVAPRSFI